MDTRCPYCRTPNCEHKFPKEAKVSESPSVTGLGLPLVEEKDPDKLRKMVASLWDLLDLIDTASDMAKSNNIFYRNLGHLKHLQ